MLGLSQPAAAAEQWSGSLGVGLALAGDTDDVVQRLPFYANAELSLLLLREGPQDFGAGPFIKLESFALQDLRVVLGPTLLIPTSWLSLVASVGGYATALGHPRSQGVHGAFFIGSRSYNYHATYSPSIGLVLSASYALSQRHETTLNCALQIDAEYLALPFLFLYSALKPSS